MTGYHSTNVERTFSRDLTYSQWHRTFEGLAFVDIDQVEICKACKEPLCFVELARDVGQNIFEKNATVTARIASRLGLRAYTLLHKLDSAGKIVSFRVIELTPKRSDLQEVLKPAQWALHLRRLHERHERDACIRRPGAAREVVQRAA